MMGEYYKLINKQVVPCSSKEFGNAWRRVNETKVAGAVVSTVFLGLDHNFADNGPPLVFETMIFGGPLDQECWRYSTYEEAEAGHANAVEQTKARAAEITESS